jgi:hypothetical protein
LIGKRPGRYQDSKGETVSPLKTTREIIEHLLRNGVFEYRKRQQTTRANFKEIDAFLACT